MMESTIRQPKVPLLFKALNAQGPGWALTRLRIALTGKLGLLERKTPAQQWSALSLATSLKEGVPNAVDEYFEWRQQNSPRFFFAPNSLQEQRALIGEDSLRVADLIQAGEFPFFGYSRSLGFPPDWQSNPVTHATAPGGHWSKVNEFESGDIKAWWETSRFSWAFALARAYTRTLDEHYAQAFWILFESWLEQNPPNWGIHWKCGQETSFRAMALCFAVHAFAGSASSTAERIAQLVTALGVHAARIAAYTDYARSQKNNHGISEGVGLWTIGLLFPELRDSERWTALGKRLIESEARRQIYFDGSYVQHSLNYHRVMLHDLAWALRLGECNDQKIAPDVYQSFRRSVSFLHALTDDQSGSAPNYGANDGALVLPLSDCVYADMRPVLQSCHFIATGNRLYPPGPWDEEMVWLNGVASLNAPLEHQGASQHDLDAKTGGYYTLRSSESWLFLRGAKYKDRPSHADQLHLDLWWRGENVVCDTGTYSYNAPAPFDHAFALTRFHNTVTVDGADQMTRITRFLWGDWSNAEVSRCSESCRGLRTLEGEHDGYRRLGVIHRRAVALVVDHAWIVVDDLVGRGEHLLRLHWQMPEVPFTISPGGVMDLQCNAGNMRLMVTSSVENSFNLVRAGECVAGDGEGAPDPSRGWSSRSYGRKVPALSLTNECRSPLPVRFVTVVMLGMTAVITVPPSCMSVQLDAKSIDLSPIGEASIFQLK